jgi:hypothetical protein
VLLDTRERLWFRRSTPAASSSREPCAGWEDRFDPLLCRPIFRKTDPTHLGLADTRTNVWTFDGERWTGIDAISALTGSRVVGVVVDSSGAVWVATDKAVGRIEGSAIRPEPGAGTDLTDVRVDPRGRVYVVRVAAEDAGQFARSVEG